MASRAELELRAGPVSVDPAAYANDSKLEQAVLYAEKAESFSAGTKASGTLTSTGTAPANNDTVTIGGVVYTFKTTLTGAPYEVLIGASAAAALDNFKEAVNAGTGAGTVYGTGTLANPYVTATTNTNTTQLVVAHQAGTQWNAVTTTEASSQLSWGAGTLASGTNDTGPSPRVVAQVSGDENV